MVVVGMAVVAAAVAAVAASKLDRCGCVMVLVFRVFGQRSGVWRNCGAKVYVEFFRCFGKCEGFSEVVGFMAFWG